MLELILVRHGETDKNIEGTYAGWTDTPLNENGRNQIKSLAEKLRTEEIAEIYSSPLQRTIQTADLINQFHDKDIKMISGLKEHNFGIWEDMLYKDIKKEYRELHDQWVQDWENFEIPEGESARQSFERTVKAIDGIICKHTDGKVVIVTHLGIIRNITAYLLGMSIEGIWRFKVSNGSITRIQITDGYSVLVSLGEL